MKTLSLNLPENCPATLLGVFEDGSAEWHEARFAGIGGSDVGAILGLSKWESPFSLWGKKSGRIESEMEESEAMEWGKRLEDVVLQKFHEKHPELELYAKPGTYFHREREWQRANPDALAFNPITKEWAIVEIKTAAYEDEWDEKLNIIPATYRAQVLWYLDVFGFERAFVATLFQGRKYREFVVDANHFEMELNLDAVQRWRVYLEKDSAPDYDGAEATYETVRKLHPLIDLELPGVELGELGIHFFNASSEFEKAEEHLREMKARVMDAMGKAKNGLIDGEVKVTRQAKGQGLPYLVIKKG